MRDLLARPEPEAQPTVRYFVYRAAKETGAGIVPAARLERLAVRRMVERYRYLNRLVEQ